jgi:hypothetical protein
MPRISIRGLWLSSGAECGCITILFLQRAYSRVDSQTHISLSLISHVFTISLDECKIEEGNH